MKITAVETTPVRVRRLRAYGTVTRTALGYADISEHGIVQVHTDEGLTGLGELSSVFARRGPLLCRDVDERLGPALVGRDPLAITCALRAMESRASRRPACDRGGGDGALGHRRQGTRGAGAYFARRQGARPDPAQLLDPARRAGADGGVRARACRRRLSHRQGQDRAGPRARHRGSAAGARRGRLRAPGAGGRQHGDGQRQGGDSIRRTNHAVRARAPRGSRCRPTPCTRWPRFVARCRCQSWPTSRSARPATQWRSSATRRPTSSTCT